jgi:hypothetical protein
MSEQDLQQAQSDPDQLVRTLEQKSEQPRQQIEQRFQQLAQQGS